MEFRSYLLNQLALARDTVPVSEADDLLLERWVQQGGITFPPILVAPLASGLYDVIDGEKRVARARHLAERGQLPSDAHRVPCMVIDVTTARERARWRLMANQHRPMRSEELAELQRVAGIEGRAARRAIERPLPAPVLRLTELLNGLSARRCAIRGVRKTMLILEIARDHCTGEIELQEAIDKLRIALDES